MTSLRDILRRYGRSEDGAGTVFGLYIFVVMLLSFGLAIDVANTWRNRTALSATVDIAAHAGTVEIAYGGSKDEIKAAIVNALDANLPSYHWGNIIKVDSDVTMAHYDVKNYGWSGIETGDDNGVIVNIERSRAYGNPVSTFVMRLMGITDFDVTARSAAVYDINGECSLNNGIWAKEKVTITTQAKIGSDYCIHSEDYVWLPQNNEFADNTMVTMRHFDMCGDKCTDSANPGIRARPAHMIFPDFRAHIINTWDAFITPGIPASGVKYEWFYKQTDTSAADYDEFDPEITLSDTSDLETALSLSSAPAKGDIIEMTWDNFMTDFVGKTYPSGLVYHVTCDKGGKFAEIVFDDTHGQLDGAVLLTNCKMQFAAGSKVLKSIVITEVEVANAGIQADEGTTMGDPDLTCAPEDAVNRSIFMSLSDVSVPADFVMANLTLIVDGNVNVAAMSSSTDVTTSYSLALYASGTVSFASKHEFASCDFYSSYLIPEGKVLRIVEPPDVLADGSFDMTSFHGSSNLNLGEILLDPYVSGLSVTDPAATTTTTTTTTTSSTTTFY